MEDEQYVALYGYLEYVVYPAGLTKSKIFVLRIEVAKITSFKDKLFYKYVGKYVKAVPLKDKSAVSVARGIYARFIADKVHLSTSSVIKEKSLLTR